MILLTVGTQLPFCRLVSALDSWCAEHPEHEAFGQIGPIGKRHYRPRNIRWTDFETPASLASKIEMSTLVVAHAGMGTIISCLLSGKPIVIMPRRSDLQEQRNDHQVATAHRLTRFPLVKVAWHEEELGAAIAAALVVEPVDERIGPFADKRLIATVRNGIMGQQ